MLPVEAGRSASGFCKELREDPRADDERSTDADNEEEEEEEAIPEKEEEKEEEEAAVKPAANDTGVFVTEGARIAREALPGGTF